MRIAIIHYWLVQMRGGERVLEHLCKMFPDAEIFTHVVNQEKLSPFLRSRKIHTSFIAGMPMALRHYQKYLPLMPLALEALDLTEYDLVISCEAGPAKGVITRPDALHITYCHSPMRYVWDQYHEYARHSGLAARITMAIFAPILRIWDTASAARTDAIITNSAYVGQRVAKFWGRSSKVVHPPIDPEQFVPSDAVSEEYLWVGQLIPYKLPEVAVRAFNQSGKKLHVVGTGSMLKELRAMAGPNVRITERLDFDGLRQAYATCRGLIFTAEEDFGMVPVEVMASGRPVLALGRGGALESVVDGKTGLFFAEKTVDCLIEALDRFEDWLPQFRPADAVARAWDFSPEIFRKGIFGVITAQAKCPAGVIALAASPDAPAIPLAAGEEPGVLLSDRVANLAEV
jgi:glycosyltransferase involved in cell wall biosynthesis